MNGDDGGSVRDPRKVTGVILIVLGLLLFVFQLKMGITTTVMYLAIGAVFVAAYFGGRSHGLLISGCILVGLGLGRLGESYAGFVTNPSYAGLGLGFLAIYTVDKLHRGTSSWWPLVPGLILLYMGVAPRGANIGRLASQGWPLVLVVVGLLYLTGRLGAGRGRGGGDPSPGS